MTDAPSPELSLSPSERLSARGPSVGSPVPAWAWEEACALSALDPTLQEQLATYEYEFRPPTSGQDAAMAERLTTFVSVLWPVPRAVFVFSWLKRGGAEYVGMAMVREAQRRLGLEAVLVVVMDWPVLESADWLAPGTRLFAPMVSAPDWSREQRRRFLVNYLATAAPAWVVNCNSWIAWEVFRDHGRTLSASSDLWAFLFCFDYDAAGRPIGYPVSHLPEAFPHLRGVLADHEGFKADAARHLLFPPAWLGRIHAVYSPTALPAAMPTRPTSRPPGWRPRILWASRVCRQKRPELVVEIARRVPEADFVMHGDIYEPEHYAPAQFEAPNLSYAGSFAMLQDLSLEDYDLFLYTAAYDGIPTILLGAGAAGLPIVSAAIGGVGEVLGGDAALLVEDSGDPAAYEQLIREALADPVASVARARRCFERLQAHHGKAAYRATLDRLGLFAEARP